MTVTMAVAEAAGLVWLRFDASADDMANYMILVRTTSFVVTAATRSWRSQVTAIAICRSSSSAGSRGRAASEPACSAVGIIHLTAHR